MIQAKIRNSIGARLTEVRRFGAGRTVTRVSALWRGAIARLVHRLVCSFGHDSPGRRGVSWHNLHTSRYVGQRQQCGRSA